MVFKKITNTLIEFSLLAILIGCNTNEVVKETAQKAAVEEVTRQKVSLIDSLKELFLNLSLLVFSILIVYIIFKIIMMVISHER
ncbi:MAG: hypothetical protein ACQESP_11050 [Candidatus Muiribacteriota bacterium]